MPSVPLVAYVRVSSLWLNERHRYRVRSRFRYTENTGLVAALALARTLISA